MHYLPTKFYKILLQPFLNYHDQVNPLTCQETTIITISVKGTETRCSCMASKHRMGSTPRPFVTSCNLAVCGLHSNRNEKSNNEFRHVLHRKRFWIRNAQLRTPIGIHLFYIYKPNFSWFQVTQNGMGGAGHGLRIHPRRK
jgi:hypothetical protein